MSEPWEHIFTKLGHTGETDFTITANEIKDCGKSWKGSANQFEPRLLCYQTSASSRPELFKKHSLYILPVENGTYLITKTPVYTHIPYDSIEEVQILRDTSSCLLSVGGSEMSLIDNLRYSGVFERPEILGEPITHGPLLGGRHRISTDFTHGEKELTIRGVQYETDSAYETENKILICEGKSSSGPIDSFNIRQLYFPYREAMRVSNCKKEVVCIFIHDLKGSIHIWKYKFTDMKRMDSITLYGHYIYRFSS
jgi:hypothetical protein